MSGKYERTFVLTVPPERAWRAFTEPRELEAWWASEVHEFDARPGGRLRVKVMDLPEYEGRVEEAEPGRRLRWTEGAGLLPGPTEVTVTFESVPEGTRVTVVQAGFGEGGDWLGQLESHSLGWNQCIADLQLHLRSGVRFSRMFTWKTSLGAATQDTPAGLEVLRVLPGTYAERVGLAPGDILLQLGSAPIFSRSDRWLIEREHAPGEELEAVFVRGQELHRAVASLS